MGNDVAMQKLLLDHLVSAGQIQMATQLAQKMGLVDFTADLAQVQSIVPSLTSGNTSGYLDLDLDNQSVLFCDTEERVQEAMDKLSLDGDLSQSIVGLDVEWKPTITSTVSAMASILQIASKANVFIIDLLALHVSHLSLYRLLGLTINMLLHLLRITTCCLKCFFQRCSTLHK